MADEHEQKLGTAHRKREIRRVLVEYLAACPMAMDTLDGIAEFWLPRQCIRTEVALLAEVLAELASEGLLEVIGTGYKRRYRLRPNAPDETGPGNQGNSE